MRIGRSAGAKARRGRFQSTLYWNERYSEGGTSGPGSYGALADFKARILNDFMADHRVRSVIEFGCGDGNQLGLLSSSRYIGLDVSTAAIEVCQTRFRHDATKGFFLYSGRHFTDPIRVFRADLALSLDVVYHLVDDDSFELYMRHLFGAADRFVAIYGPNVDAVSRVPHIRWRRFTDWADRNTAWTLARHVANPHKFTGDYTVGSTAEFFFYARTTDPPSGPRL